MAAFLPPSVPKAILHVIIHNGEQMTQQLLDAVSDNIGIEKL